MSMLTAALEQCLEVCWGETHEVLTDLTAPPVCKEVSQRALEILKILFNITYNVHRQEVDEVNAIYFPFGISLPLKATSGSFQLLNSIFYLII